jgi:hypothetical protein
MLSRVRDLLQISEPARRAGSFVRRSTDSDGAASDRGSISQCGSECRWTFRREFDETNAQLKKGITLELTPSPEKFNDDDLRLAIAFFAKGSLITQREMRLTKFGYIAKSDVRNGARRV